MREQLYEVCEICEYNVLSGSLSYDHKGRQVCYQCQQKQWDDWLDFETDEWPMEDSWK